MNTIQSLLVAFDEWISNRLFMLWSVLMQYWKPYSLGEHEDTPLKVQAVPGLTTLLDVALYHAVEGELVATVTSGHALLQAWLEVKQQAVKVLACCRHEADVAGNQRHSQTESFARACFEAAYDAIERLSTDKLASTVNLTDPFDQGQSSAPAGQETSSSNASGAGQQHFWSSTTTGGTNTSAAAEEVIASALEDSSHDTARRGYPNSQRGRDCWESLRLHCPDYVWADDTAQCSQRLLRQLWKHQFTNTSSPHNTGIRMSISGTDMSSLETSLQSVVGYGNIGGSRDGTGSASAAADTAAAAAAYRLQTSLSPHTERQAAILLQLILADVPTRLVQFRSSVEADAVVAKRLYLIKCQYRAPFRAFLEAHTAEQRAPTLDLVDEYLKPQTPVGSASPNTNTGETQTPSPSSKPASKSETQPRLTAKKSLNKLMKAPILVEALALEKLQHEMEVEMAKALFSFAELARYLEQKRARLRTIPDIILTLDDLRELQELVRRLRGLLCRKPSGPDMTTGIRPLLLDLQGVGREDCSEDFTWCTTKQSPTKQDAVLNRLDLFTVHLQTLGELCKTRNAFRVEKKTELDLPAQIVRGCTNLDVELFKCHFEDWYMAVRRQHELCAKNVEEDRPYDLEEFAEMLRNAEMRLSLSVASKQSLGVVRERLEMIASDREARFSVLNEMVQEVALREMNLHITLVVPDPRMTLELKPTTELGIFGLPLVMAGETLPIG